MFAAATSTPRLAAIAGPDTGRTRFFLGAGPALILIVFNLLDLFLINPRR